MNKKRKISAMLKRLLPEILFFALSGIVLMLASIILFGFSFKGIFLALLLWSLPLFLH